MKTENIKYEVSMPEPNSHYFEVKMEVATSVLKNSKKEIDFLLPVWTPGSYLVREFAKNVESFEAFGDDKRISQSKINKYTWRVKNENFKKITIKYNVYAYELSVRTSYLDNSHGYINGASVFMYIQELKNAKASLTINAHKSFAKIATALPKIADNKFEIENYDTLVDSPIEIGNHEIIEFEALGIKHTIANYSIEKLNYGNKDLVADYKKIVEAAASVVNVKHPCKNYLFIIHHLPHIGGGLEHLNSTTCQTEPDVYLDDAQYKGFLSLIAHEYFHLWNVKRIRPVVLGPFDYQNENYTHMLWVSEGFTSFYEEDILRKADFKTETEFLTAIASKIGTIENSAGNKVQSVTESSWDAWIKFYRPNENSGNSTVSYYTKGGLLGAVLNANIIDKTNGTKSLDDVMRYLWDTYYIKANRGFTDDEFKKACETISGTNLDDFFNKYVNGTESIDYEKYFTPLNVIYTAQSTENEPYLGLTIRNKMIARVDKNAEAYKSGIYVNDEVLSIDGQEFSQELDFLKNKKVGEIIKIEIYRSGLRMPIELKISANPNRRFKLEKGTSTDALAIKKYNKFLNIR